jgi:hypothetical protein
MDVNFLKKVETNLRLEWACNYSEIQLMEAQKKSPERDYSEIEMRNKVFREFQFTFLETVEENRLMERKYVQAIGQNAILIELIEKLKKEVEMYKLSINF